MAFGYTGNILRINLTERKISVEQQDDRFYRTYMGGKAIIAYYLLKEIDPKIDGLDENNKLIFATGVMTGLPMAGMPRYTVGAKSPLIDGFGQSEAGGFWGPELKKAGFDAIIVEGKSEKPVYISIRDQQVEIKDAQHLWGKETGEVQEMIRTELKNPHAIVAQIGPGGEKLVRYACITNNLKHYNGRNGMGAVMGSKNLRAIAVSGTGKIEFHDPETIHKISKDFLSIMMEHPQSRGLYDYGTSGAVAALSLQGYLPSYNFQIGEFEDAEQITGQKLVETLLKKREGCYACALKCKRVVEIDEENCRVDPKFGGPEYETIAGFSCICGCNDLKIVSKANELCNRYGIDTITAALTISFVMECFQKGILTSEDTGGIEVNFGDSAVIYKLIEMIAKREGFGDLLAEGSFRVAEKIGRGSELLVMTSKKQETASLDGRTKAGLILAYGSAENGPDHMYVIHDQMLAKAGAIVDELSAIGVSQPVDTLDFGWEKARVFKALSEWTSFMNSAGVCILAVMPRGAVSAQTVVDLLRAATGWNTSLDEILKAGERAIAMGRMFNIACGMTKEDDFPSPKHFLPLVNIKAPSFKVDRQEYDDLLVKMYKIRGYGEDGVPSEAKLHELSIGWLA